MKFRGPQAHPNRFEKPPRTSGNLLRLTAFFMKFRGRNAHPNRGEKPPRGVGSEPGDRQDWQRISGTIRRKSMPVLSVPGALVGGDEVSMAVFHELSRAEGPSQQTTKGAPSVPLRSDAQGGALCRWFGFGGGRRVHGFVARSGVEIAVAGGAVGAVPLGEGLPYDTVHGSPIPRDQLQPLPRTLWREVNPAEEDARHEMADLVGDRFIGDGIEGSLCGGRTVGDGLRVVDFVLHIFNGGLKRRVGNAERGGVE